MLKGDLTTSSLAEVLRDLAATTATGCLHIDSEDGDEALVYLKNGVVYSASVPGRRPQLGARLVSSGALAPESLEEALEAQSTELQGWRLGELLVHLGYVDRSVVESFVIEQLREAAYDLSRWRTGRWKFRKNEKTREDLGGQASVEELLAEVDRRAEEWVTIAEAVHGPTAVPVLSAGGLSAAELTLDQDQWALLCKVDGERSIAQLARDCGFTDYEAAQIVFALVQAGLLDVEETVGDDEEPTSAVGRLATVLAFERRPSQDDHAEDGLAATVTRLANAFAFGDAARTQADAADDADTAAELAALLDLGDEAVDDEPLPDAEPVAVVVDEALTIEEPGVGELVADLAVDEGPEDAPAPAPLVNDEPSAIDTMLLNLPDLTLPSFSLPASFEPEMPEVVRASYDAADAEALAAATAELAAEAETETETDQVEEIEEVEEVEAAAAEVVETPALPAIEIATVPAAAVDAASVAIDYDDPLARISAALSSVLDQELRPRIDVSPLAPAGPDPDEVARRNAELEEVVKTRSAAAAELARMQAEEEAARRAAEEAHDDQERQAAEEAQRHAAEEVARLEAEAARLAAEEAERLEAERVEAERLEAERVAAEEEARLEAERLETERLETERLEAERLEAQRLEAERLEAEEEARLEAERLEAEEEARLEAEGLEAEEEARLEAERLEAEEEARLEAERLEAERLEAERLEAERLEAEEEARLEAERIETERLEAERLEAERLEAERLEAERLEAERLEAERVEAERLEAERLEAERSAADEEARVEAERVEAERVEAERVEAERVEAERVEAERVEAERVEAERVEAERLMIEAAERAEAEAAEAARMLAEVSADEVHESRSEANALFAEMAAQNLVEPEPEPEPEPERERAVPARQHTMGLSDTAALMRELTSLGLDDDEPTAPVAPRAPRPAPAPDKSKKRKGLFSR